MYRLIMKMKILVPYLIVMALLTLAALLGVYGAISASSLTFGDVIDNPDRVALLSLSSYAADALPMTVALIILVGTSPLIAKTARDNASLTAKSGS